MDAITKKLAGLLGRKSEKKVIASVDTDAEVITKSLNSVVTIQEPKYTVDDLTSKLPLDVVRIIFSFLKPEDLSSLCLVNRHWRTLSSDNFIWKSLIERELTDSEAYENLIKTYDSNTIWKSVYLNLLTNAVFVECASSLQLSEDRRTVSRASQSRHFGQLAVGRLLTSGKHKYSFKINDSFYIGIGVGSSIIQKKSEDKKFSLEGESLLHCSRGCSVYYYTGYWYGGNFTFNFDKTFQSGDVIDVILDVENDHVTYFKNGEKVISCNSNARNPYPNTYENSKLVVPPGMRIAVVVGQMSSQVSIIGYSRLA